MQAIRAAVAIFICLFVTAGCQLGQTASARLQTLFADEWEFRLRENPVFATSTGDRRYNDQLSRVSLADSNRRAAKTKEFLTRLNAIDPSQLNDSERVNYHIFKRLKQDTLAEFSHYTHLIPITNRWGFYSEFPELPDKIPLKTVEDYENYIKRLKAFKAYSAGHVELMREGMRKGYVLPQVVLQGVPDTIKPHIVKNPRKSLLYKPFETFPESFDSKDQSHLAKTGRSAITKSVIPGFESFLKFLVDEYIPAARKEIGASKLPNGKAFYQHRVNRFTTLDISPKEVHELGLAEVKRIRSEMKTIIEKVGFKGSIKEFTNDLRTNKKFYAANKEDFLEHISYILKKADGKLPRLFGRMPRMPYGLREIPGYMAASQTAAYYQRPSGDGTRAGFYYINTYDLPSRPLYAIEALSLHEAVPGHHFQIALQQEIEDLPNFRKFSGFTAFVEGWALYAERLGLEIDFYQDPYSDYGRLSMEIWRACRLVVDTGIHYFGWSRQQAIDYMTDNSALTMHNIRTEVDRYISWPGQALAYKMGELKIRELRAKAEKQLGDKFDIRAFHDMLLAGGSVPLDILENQVTDWIAKEKQ